VQRKHIHVRGIVQGVGFRPFVYNLAGRFGLSGFVFNSSSGVTIEIEGGGSEVENFLRILEQDAPQLAEVEQVTVAEMKAEGSVRFCILESREVRGDFALVPADTGVCTACWDDFGDVSNRRYGYAFTNCTHCGPRYTILRNTPYDRATTTMSTFTMCPACQAEYEDPEDRRFHAQPNACPLCGPSLELFESGSASQFKNADSLSTIRQARALLHEGRILAVKGLGGFLLACDATNETAVTNLRLRKRRPHKPFALMVRDLAAARRLCTLSAEDEASLLSPRRPIVILPQRAGAVLVTGIAPGDKTLGVMLPYTPLHFLLFSNSPGTQSEFPALVMSSGNVSEEPIVVSNDEATRQLSGVADWFLVHNREIATRVDDSVVRTFEGKERVLRRARGFVPQPIALGIETKEVLAFGGELKNTFCFTKGGYAILSQHIGNLENYETMQFFEEALANLMRIFHAAPVAAAYDLHPGYMSTRMAMASAMQHKIGVQHHHAHIASCMAENHLQGKVLGVALDGTGYGTDGKIWGGEFLAADFSGFTRRAHFRNVLMPGGDAAVRQPWRMARSYLHDVFGGHIPSGLRCFENIEHRLLGLVDTMLRRQIQTVETSSCGRLFDAVAALLGIASQVTFEGQAAVALEAAAEQGIEQRYDFEIAEGEPMVLDFRPTIAAIVADLSRRRPATEISACFQNTLSTAIAEACVRIRKTDALDRICLSGGSFQNLYLLGRTVVELRRRGFGVFLHAQVPPNDGGLSLGQAMIANQRLREGD
jgi:hydrogenase maturation protein HypF